MKKVYLDNAATTSIYDEVIDTMIQTMKNQFGNPSSIHSFGQDAKSVIETARRSIASLLNANPQEIIFTSCGTESNNLIIRSCVDHLGVKRIITSALEHKCVLETTLDMMTNKSIEVKILSNNAKGELNIEELEHLLKDEKPTLVSIMHANNEFGNINNIQTIGELCKQHNAYFHSDTVQTIGHYIIDFEKLPVDFASASAHKFHGPKGSGFAYIRKSSGLKAKITGGGQERNMRSGTENVYGICGMAKALEISYNSLEKDQKHLNGIKKYAIEKLQHTFSNIQFNGNSADLEKSLYTVLNIFLPFKNDLIGFQLDMKGIAVSQGSACSSGASKPSIALSKIRTDEELRSHSAVRLSFSHENTTDDIDALAVALQEISKNSENLQNALA